MTYPRGFNIESKTLKVLTFFLAFSMGFTRDSNVYVFYLGFALFSFVSILVLLKLPKKKKISFIIRYYIAFSLFAGMSINWAIDANLASDMFIRLLVIIYLMLLINLLEEKLTISTAFVQGLVTLISFNFLLYLSPLDLSAVLEGVKRFSGTFNNSNELAVVTVFTIFFYSRLKQKEIFTQSNLYFLFLIISALIIFSTGSRKGLVLGIILISSSILFTATLQQKKKILLLSFIFLPIGLLLLSQISNVIQEQDTVQRIYDFLDYFQGGKGDVSTKWRFKFMEAALKIFNDNKWIGVGIDNFQTFFGKGLYAHNNYVEILADLGLVGFILLYGLYFHFIFFLRRYKVGKLEYIFFFTLLAMEFFMVTYYMRIFWVALIFMYMMIKKDNRVEIENSTITK